MPNRSVRLTSRVVLAALALSLFAARDAAAQVTPSPEEPDGVTALLRQLEQVLLSGDQAQYVALLTDGASRDRARDFAATELGPGVIRAILQERAREPLFGTIAGEGYEVLVDIFAERTARARIATWRLELKRTREAQAPNEMDLFAIDDQERMNAFDGLYKISLDATTQYDARNLQISAEDLRLTLTSGTVFVANTEAGVTSVVLMGQGNMLFTPPSETEKGQVRIFSGGDTLETPFNAAYIRLNPNDFERMFSPAEITSRAVDPRDFRRADEIFKTESAKSYTLDLADLSPDAWSLLPSAGDFLAEVRTRKYDTLTYAREEFEAEDVTLFERKNQRNIALYPSLQRIARSGRFYNDDDLAEYDILDYDLDLSFTPERQWVEGLARVRLKIKAPLVGTLTMRLAEPLALQSIVSDRFGRLLSIRVKNQNSIVINLPTGVPRDTEMELTIGYAGRLPPQDPERETAMIGDQLTPSQVPLEQGEAPLIASEPSFLYSNRIYWYPQGTRSDFATATMRVNVPARYNVVASGVLEEESPSVMPADDPTLSRRLYTFNAKEPQRYLAVLLSRFELADQTTVNFDGVTAPGGRRSMTIMVQANPRQVGAGRDLMQPAADVAKFYAGLVGDSPYPSFTLALVESDLPGGHSPAYFAQLNTPGPMKRFAWRNDPVVFSGFPEFFLAHEMAHQWWGQAVGWGNYHEQWLSEGFSQYFAAMYAKDKHGDQTFAEVMRQLRKWSLDETDQGPVYLGYRLGHIRGDSRIFRAVVYNKGAAVLHMLRQLVGDEAFFKGIRRFYIESRFRKVGTEDFRKTMEAEAGRPLQRFFDRWIYGATLPNMTFTYRVEGNEAVLHFDQAGEVFDVPVTVTLQYMDNTRADVLVPVTEASAEMRVPLTGTLRIAEVSFDSGTLAEIK